jgi:hypothetical protein
LSLRSSHVQHQNTPKSTATGAVSTSQAIILRHRHFFPLSCYTAVIYSS